MNVIELRGITKVYGEGDAEVHALRQTNLTFSAGVFTAIMGASGSGKSTLLNIIGMLDLPTAGEYFIENQNVAHLDDNELSQTRCLRIGFIFQSFNLLSNFTVLENVCVPMQYADAPKAQMLARGEEIIELVGLTDRISHRPSELSGGQCQRVAIARALANDPTILLADEPTGNLDEKTGLEVLQIFHRLSEQGRTILMVTHNPEYREIVERVITLHDGEVIES